MYYQTKALGEVLLEKSFNYTGDYLLKFDHIINLREFWKYLDAVLLPGLYGFNEDDNTLSVEKGYLILGENELVGPLQFRQLRVRNNSCNIHYLFQSNFKHCYAEFSSSSEDYESFGDKNGTAWSYSTNVGPRTWGILKTYPSGGYIQNFYYDAIKTRNAVNYLKPYWIDKGTRVIFIEFTIFNRNSNLFCVAQLIFEFPSSGGILTSHNFRVLPLKRFICADDYFIFICEILFGVQVIWATTLEIYEMYTDRWKYLSRFWNWIDLSIITVDIYTSIVSSPSCIVNIFSISDILSYIYIYNFAIHLH